MNSFEMFLAQVDPATIARESFTGEGHRQMVRAHLLNVAEFERWGRVQDDDRNRALTLSGDEHGDARLQAVVADWLKFSRSKPKQPRKPKQTYRPGGSKSLGYQELQRVQALTKKEK
ncbi:hypothetical protein [Cryobacterium sp. Y57]|uniref:hypothetical protein n=1 Tax=Cryobacterium sp. Y57 TaxID=2048287 RepID=UPI000CE3F9A3|nr:hypothetical protein [Cryobacterium sp. Y57]